MAEPIIDEYPIPASWSAEDLGEWISETLLEPGVKQVCTVRRRGRLVCLVHIELEAD
ncbi:MAG: hypothetical protein R3236_04560 [Phycisphaeraceae bacterium]|nr:hypothetical protein [Phycisphaeraceae bacterium]